MNPLNVPNKNYSQRYLRAYFSGYTRRKNAGEALGLKIVLLLLIKLRGGKAVRFGAWRVASRSCVCTGDYWHISDVTNTYVPGTINRARVANLLMQRRICHSETLI